MELLFWLLIVFLLTYEPIYGYFDFQKFVVKVRRDQRERVKYYKKIMVGLWVPALLILGTFTFGSGVTLKDVGLNLVTINTELLGKWVTYIALGLGILYLLYIIYFMIASRFSEKMKQEIAKFRKQELENSKFVDIMPVTKEDKKVWTFVSWTAGITEEIIYRGFLVYALTTLVPALPIWGVLIISAMIFGLAHTYQGFGNVIRTGIIGLFFGILYISLNSILPIIIFHFLIDYIGKIGEES